ncbi:TPA: DUF551 domain-containing protein [Klebsiella pneumoniae]
MTKSTITREESVQAVFDLKVGYRLGFADIEILKRVARMALAAMDSSESVEMPLDYLQGHKDGLEWAAQLAEANHPDTGDWLYDDPIELAKAIRKGPDMPPAQPVAYSEPVAWTDEEELRDVNVAGIGYLFGIDREANKFSDPRRQIMLYRHAQPAPVVPEEATPDSIEILASARRRDHAVFQWDEDQRNAAADSWNAFRAAMRQELKKSAGTEAICRSDENVQVLHTKSPAQSDCCPAQNQGWIPVSERMPEDEQEVLTINKMGHRFVSFFDKHSGLFFDRLDAPAACCIEHVLVTHWMPLPAAPQEVR